MISGSRTAVITGATRGLGRELSLAFGAAGYHVIGLYRFNAESASALSEEFASRGYSGSFIRQDITTDGEWTEFDRAIHSTPDQEFTLVANASASFVPKPLHLVQQPELDDLLRVNVSGTLNVLKRLLPKMASARSGRVVSVLSSALQDRPKGFAAYMAAKAALRSLMESAASEYHDRGLRFVCVSPGFMETPLTASWSPHLRASLNVKTSDVSFVASRVLEIANDLTLPGRGENYPIGNEGASFGTTAS